MTKKRLTKWEAKWWEAWATDGLAGNDLRPHFDVSLTIHGLDVLREFDFGSLQTKLLIEIDGLGGYDPVAKRERCGGHQTAKGMRADSAKRNAAVETGWRVLVYPSSALDSAPRLAASIEQVNRVMSGASE